MSVIEFPKRRAAPREYRGPRTARVWRWTVVSGLALFVLATVHIVAQHFVVHGTGGLRNYHQVISYIANPVMFVIECGFLLALAIHGMLGIRSILHDFDFRPRTLRRIDRGLWMLGTLTVSYGLIVLSVLASRA